MKRIWSILVACGMLLTLTSSGFSGSKAAPPTSAAKWGGLSTGSTGSVGPAKAKSRPAKAKKSLIPSWLSKPFSK